MAQSVVDCCNDAIAKVGGNTITALTDDSPEARWCSTFYDCNRRRELRSHRWNFAIKRAVLAPDAAAPLFGYLYQFTIPVDCLRILLPRNADLDWKLEGRKILSNCEDGGEFIEWLEDGEAGGTGGVALNLRYVADITDATLWDSAFYDTLSLAIAIDICEPLTNSNAKKAQLMQEYKDTLNEAQKNNAFEQRPQEPPSDSFWLARM